LVYLIYIIEEKNIKVLLKQFDRFRVSKEETSNSILIIYSSVDSNEKGLFFKYIRKLLDKSYPLKLSITNP
jgi:hypothetical protein